jgi:hypothetical protein
MEIKKARQLLRLDLHLLPLVVLATPNARLLFYSGSYFLAGRTNTQH